MNDSVCVSVCLFVCLSVCFHISKTTHPNFTESSVHVTCGRGPVLLSDGSAIHYVLSVLWMTS